MNLLDMRTILLSYIISNAVCLIVIGSLWLQNRRRLAGLGFWLADFAMQFVAALLIALRGTLPDIASIVLANGLIIAGIILLYIGLERFAGKTTSQIHNYFFLGIFLLTQAYFVLIQPNLMMRAIVLSLGVLLVASQCMWLLIYRVSSDLRPITRGVGYIFLALCLLSLARVIALLIIHPGNDLLKAGISAALIRLTDQMLFITLTFGLLLMVNRRLVMEMERDIVEREQAEKKQELERARWQGIVEGIADEVWTCDAQGKMSLLNLDTITAMELEMFKDKSVEEVYQEVDIFYLDGQPRPPGQAPLLRSLTGEVVRGEEIMQNHRTGKRRYRQFSSAPTRDASGAITGAVAIVRDVTEQKLAEEGLHRYELLSEHSRDIILMIRREDGRILEVNTAALEAYGYSRDEMLRLSITDLRAKSVQGLTAELMARADGGGILFETIHQRKDGSTFPAEVSSRGATISGVRSLISIVRDITERKRAEELLRENEARLQQALIATRAGIWQWDIQTDKNIWSDELWSLYGLEPYSSEPTYDTWLATVHPDDRVKTTQIVDEAAKNESDLNVEWRVIHKDGTVHWLMSRGQPVRNSAGQVIRFIGTVLDITERKRAEEALRTSEERFRFALANSPVMLASLDRQLRYTWVYNPLAGFKPEDVVGRTVGFSASPEDTEKMLKSLEEVLRNGTPAQWETTIQTPEGMKFFQSHAEPLRDSQSEITGVKMLSIDITERKQAEKEINTLSKFPTENPYPVMRVRNDGRLSYANAASRDLLELWDCAVNDCIPEELRDLIPVTVNHGSTKNIDVPCRDKIYSLTLVSIPDGGYVNIYGNDITARKRAEHALQESEEKYRLIAENSNDWIYWIKPDKTFQYVSPSCERITGFAAWEFMQDPHLLIDILHPEDRERVRTHLEELSEGRETHNLDFRILTKTKEVRWISHSCDAVYSADGEYMGRNATNRDITDQKHAAERVQRSEAMLRSIIEQMPSGVTARDARSGEIILSNSRSQEILMALVDTPVHFDSYRGFHPDGRPYQNEEWPLYRSMATGEVVHAEEVNSQRSDGSWITMSINSAPIRDPQGQIVMGVAVFDDITRRKLMEEALRANEERYRAIFDYAMDAILVSDPTGAGRILSANPAACRLFGYSMEEFLEKRREDILDTNDPNLAALLEEREQGRKAIAELTYKRKDGTHFSGELSATLYQDQNGERRGISIVRDVTERKKAELELQRTLEELQRSNAELEEFAYVASHDLQEPLRGIAGLSQLLQRRYKGQLDSRADEYILHIVDGTQRMQRLIDDLLAYSRVGRRGNPLQITEAEVPLKVALKNLDAAIQEVGAQITSESLPRVKADATQLTQLFQNLISNAIKFRSERPPQIHIGVTDAGDFWKFCVRDNGIGIEAQYFERIFQVFQRLHTRREYKGTGIGLAICKKIIERHSGQLWVESQVGQGSTFYFTLLKGQ